MVGILKMHVVCFAMFSYFTVSIISTEGHLSKMEYIYEDTKCISGVEPEYQWGEIYRLVTHRIRRCKERRRRKEKEAG